MMPRGRSGPGGTQCFVIHVVAVTYGPCTTPSSAKHAATAVAPERAATGSSTSATSMPRLFTVRVALAPMRSIIVAPGICVIT